MMPASFSCWAALSRSLTHQAEQEGQQLANAQSQQKPLVAALHGVVLCGIRRHQGMQRLRSPRPTAWQPPA